MAEGKQINLDEGECSIIQCTIENSIYAISPYLNIVFETTQFLDFGSTDNYLTYLGSDWVPCTQDYNITEVNETWQYELCCLPRFVYQTIKDAIRNTRELANYLNINLSRDSINMTIPVSMINQKAAHFIQDNRCYSFEINKRKNTLGDTMFIYATDKCLYSNTLRNIVSQQTKKIEIPEETPGNILYDYQDYTRNNNILKANGAEVWKEADYIYDILGPQFKVQTNATAEFLSTYTLVSDNMPYLEAGVSLLCTYTKQNILDPSGCTYCFTYINLQDGF